MQSRDFVFWLQGFLELQNPQQLTKEQVEMVKRHLALVFKYEIDPSYTDDENLQQELQQIHDGFQPFSNGHTGPPKDDEITIRC